MANKVDVVVVGAGLAGLRAAQLLSAAGRDVVLLEAGDGVGGRVRTDRVDGFTLDRGFQLYNPAYPEGRLAWPGLAINQFAAGVEVVREGAGHPLADPRRAPSSALVSLRSVRGLGATRGLAALALYGARLGTLAHPRPPKAADAAQPISQALRSAGVDATTLDAVVRPFLSGVLADDELSTPRAVADPILRTFLAGTPGVPDGGMEQLPRRLAADLTVHLNARVTRVAPGRVETADEQWLASDVVVAVADPAGLVPASAATGWRALTTWYFAAAGLPQQHRMLLVSPDSMLANVAVLSDVAPTYSPPGRTLVAASAVGYHDSARTQDIAQRDAAAMLDVAPSELEPVAHYPIAEALPEMSAASSAGRGPVVVGGIVLAGDHRSAPSINGALASGRRAAELLGA
ncbi:MAG: NAD(P)/FAD-dependent oxidoreductase [Candidatus Nanopelagicales bacterium]